MAGTSKQLVQGRLVLEATPLGFDKVGRDDHDGPTGRVHRLADCLRQAVRSAAGRAVAVLQAKFVSRRAVLQVGGQHLLDKRVVLGAVRQESVEKFAVRSGHSASGRPQTDAVTGVAPNAHRLPVDEDEEDDECNCDEGHQSGHQKRKIILDDPLLDDGSSRRSRTDAEAAAGSVRSVQHFRHEDGQAGHGRIALVGHANQLDGVRHFRAGRAESGPEFGEESAVATPRIVVERQGVEFRRVGQQIPNGEIDQPIAVQSEDLQVFQSGKRPVLDGSDGVVVQVELAERLQIAEFESFQRADAVVFQVEHVESSQSVESPVVDDFDSAGIQEEQTQILATDKLVAGQGPDIGTVQVQFRHVHRDPFGQIGMRSAGAVDDISRPGLVVVAGAVGGAGHLAIAGVKVATMAQGETVGLVGAQEVGRRGLDQRDVGALRPAAV